MKIDWSEVEWGEILSPLAGPWAPLYCGILHLSTRMIGEVIAIGDTAHPLVPDWLGASLTVLNFPMFYLPTPLGDWLKQFLTDNGTINLFSAIDALFWTHLVVWLLSRPRARTWLVIFNTLCSCHRIFKFLDRLADLSDQAEEANTTPPLMER